MEYPQNNPLPLPESGPYQEVEATMRTVFDWRYALQEQKLLSLYEKGKDHQWNASDLDWSVDVDVEKHASEGGFGRFMIDALDMPVKLDEREAIRMHVHQNAFMLSQFLHGEQGALISAAKIVQTVPWAEAKFYAANQVADEARHVEVYHRYLTEKLGINYEIHPSLRALLDDIITDSRWDITYLGMQILVEGLALAAFGMMRMVMSNEPLIQDITARVMQDEARHVAFGVLSLQKLYEGEMTTAELREREDFVIEGSHLLYERLIAEPVFERLGWDRDVWLPWARSNPFHKGFRQMMFSKIVPNLRRLGLLTPRVREAFATLDILRYEDQPDSVEAPEVMPPAELVQMLMSSLNKPAPAQ